jgi:phospholipase/carboxylesterase
MMTNESVEFVHVHVPPPAGSTDTRTLVLLHGTGGDERDLLNIGETVAPGARLLGIRGQVLEVGMPRFFRRLAEGVFDEADIIRRARDLVGFIAVAAERYGFDRSQVAALGYSNGANIASAAMLLHPQVFQAAVLLRAMVPLQAPPLTDLRNLSVLVSEGELDPIVPRANAERLAAMLSTAGAKVSLRWEPAGHALTVSDVEAARTWMAAYREPG